ncbi:MAG: 3-dehydroquinate synthase [Phascolarctobacterium sp.]|uniref:3-dehydroquinate synthase n=1 Tax=Phascolarctobacterium sp. TaxID=2049039 RepID=UPI0025E0AEB2|nr:3-dehydroquinate synthase [Phascolarctobacterium sp.]MCC8157893.1 3-dehydroquinate synthase [Phascolarctobacterium sp.]
MRTITVALGEKTYKIEIAAGLLDQIGPKARALSAAAKAAVISDSNVDPLYGERLERTLADSGFEVTRIVFEAGEQSKNLATLGYVYDELARAGLTRSDLLLTLGGGVPGDLGGLAAATFLRGIDFIQVPTSLLAQIDSSVGGKVAIDLPAGKNLVGSFYQPKAVFIDPELLQSLLLRFLHDGLAEAIKYGCIRDAALFEQIAAIDSDAELLEQADSIIETCCNIKARIVEKDEFDTGERMLLNFGHTIGHAIEQCCGFTTYTHGEGVGIGMVQLTRQTEKLGLTAAGTAAQISSVLQKFGLPVTASFNAREILQVMALDKKKSGRKITLVIIEKTGVGRLHKIDWQELPAYIGQENV